VTLGIANASFVAQAVDWIPELLYSIISQAFHHKGCSFVRVVQRCPEFVPDLFEDWKNDPGSIRVLTHEEGLQISPSLSKIYQNQEQHDPSNLDRAREIASLEDEVPVGILYRNTDAVRYEELRDPEQPYPSDKVKTVLEAELDKFTVWPAE
jgi:2-oxoglutarate ferredoxin oxidoreductase subunit beta